MKNLIPRKTVFKSLGTGFLLIVALGCGIGIGQYRRSHAKQLTALKSAISYVLPTPDKPYKGEGEILRDAFTKPISPGEKIYSQITSLDGIKQVNDAIFLPIELFFDAYQNITLGKTEQLELDNGATKLVKLRYTLGGRVYSAYAYGRLDSSSKTKQAALIIPGSGLNQSSAIYKKDPDNYHFGVFDALGPDYNVFVFIKPNEDVLAFHDGRAKLDESFFVNWHLNRGSSYSAAYIAQSLAFTKFLQSNYKDVAVIGLSQGGAAAMLNVLQSEPEAAIIASGYSVIAEQKAEGSGFNQIIIPNVSKLLVPERLTKQMAVMKTNFLFTWGKRETGGYKIEAEECLTCVMLKEARNANFVIHDGGHVFPVSEIQSWLKSKGQG